MENNFLNFRKKEIDKPIFRIIPIPRLFELFEKKSNVLVNPKLWDDPFENFIMNSQLRFKSGISIGVGFKENLYGQCWTQTRENDALWRIYSPDKNGARITTTPRKLLKALYDDSYPDSAKSAFIGKVEYFTTNKLLKLLNEKGTDWIMDPTGKGQAQTLLFKRKAFDHENEVRLIYNSYNKFQHPLCSFELEPLELIDDIVFDPRIEYSEFRKHKNILKDYGFTKRIVRSNLYKIPQLEIQL